MNWRFWKKDEPEFYEEKPTRKKPTLHQVADEILIKEMKRDPTGYGLKAAERLKGITKDKAGSGLEELKSLAGGFGIDLKDLGKPKGGSIVETLVGVLPAIPKALEEFRKMQNEAWERQLQQIELSTGTAPQLEQAQRKIDQPKASKVQGISTQTLGELLELEPERAVAALNESNPDWIKFVASQTYDQMIKIFEKIPKSEANAEYLEAILSEEREDWLKTFIKEAKKLTK